MGYLTAIAKVRHEILRDNEEPRDILISQDLRRAVLRECGLYAVYQFEAAAERLMGMKIEWTKSTGLTKPQISIRTTKGDTRVVTFAGDEPQPRP